MFRNRSAYNFTGGVSGGGTFNIGGIDVKLRFDSDGNPTNNNNNDNNQSSNNNSGSPTESTQSSFDLEKYGGFIAVAVVGLGLFFFAR